MVLLPDNIDVIYDDKFYYKLEKENNFDNMLDLIKYYNYISLYNRRFMFVARNKFYNKYKNSFAKFFVDDIFINKMYLCYFIFNQDIQECFHYFQYESGFNTVRKFNLDQLNYMEMILKRIHKKSEEFRIINFHYQGTYAPVTLSDSYNNKLSMEIKENISMKKENNKLKTDLKLKEEESKRIEKQIQENMKIIDNNKINYCLKTKEIFLTNNIKDDKLIIKYILTTLNEYLTKINNIFSKKNKNKNKKDQAILYEEYLNEFNLEYLNFVNIYDNLQHNINKELEQI